MLGGRVEKPVQADGLFALSHSVIVLNQVGAQAGRWQVKYCF